VTGNRFYYAFGTHSNNFGTNGASLIVERSLNLFGNKSENQIKEL
jgi:hypothetical protein